MSAPRRRLRPEFNRRIRPQSVGILTAAWVLMWGDLSVANVLSGVLLGSGVLLLFPMPELITGLTVRPLRLFVLLGQFFYDMVRASIEVAWWTVRPAGAPPSSLVDIRLTTADELFQTIIAEMTALVPGTVVIHLDAPGRVLTLHVLGSDKNSPEDIRAMVEALERRVLWAFARDPISGSRVPAAGKERT